jgi:GT2 family glycosyltransferase
MGNAPPRSGAGQDPVVSVCVANYNGIKVIDECLLSVLRQEGDIAVEILVHDDASSDGSAAYIRDRYPEARLIACESNVGFCVANNRMAAAARGKYLLLLNNDAALFPGALQTLLSEARRLDRPAILGLPQYDAASGELIDIGSLFDPFLNAVPNRNPARNEVGMIIGACLWLPKTLWVELGGFPEWFHTLAEDMWLCARARLAGYPVRAIGTSGFRHWVGHSLGGGKVTSDKRLATSRHRRALSERNKSFVMVITYPSPLFQVLFPLHLVLLVLEGAILALIKWELKLFQGIYLACLRSLWQERERLFRLRQKIQAERSISLSLFWSAFQIVPHKLRMLLRHGLPHLK